jgi:propanol-preferring alcohol dehydrogenase
MRVVLLTRIENMQSARIHNYQESLVLDNIEKPKIEQDSQVLLRIGATGLCHSDLHLINGDWRDSIPLNLPVTPGHEIAGWVEEIGNAVPKDFIQKGDMVAVFGGWGCGVCIYCKQGNEQSCPIAKWPGISKDGGFSEYLLVDSYRFLIKVADSQEIASSGTKFRIEEIAPLTDAGLTPYRAIKTVRNMLGPGKSIGIVGIGGLGYYAVQYAKMLGQSSVVVAFDLKEEKLKLAQEAGADFTIDISTSSKESNLPQIKSEVSRITKGKGIDVIIDCVGAENTIYNSIRLLSKGGCLVIVGLFGNNIKAPLVPSVLNEYKICGSLWGNYNELREVLWLATNGRIKPRISKFPLSDINDAIDLLKNGKILGRGVIVP